MARRIPDLIVEDATIRFRNFSGNEGRFNRKGDRNFAIFLDPDKATDLTADGWNVKTLKPREDADPDQQPQDYMQISVNYSSGRPPKIVLITHAGRTQLDEDSVNILDFADIEKVDLIVNPYEWEVQDKRGVKAYLKSMFVTLHEDELDLKYADVPDSGQNTIGLGTENG
jgi:hypothetical protein